MATTLAHKIIPPMKDAPSKPLPGGGGGPCVVAGMAVLLRIVVLLGLVVLDAVRFWGTKVVEKVEVRLELVVVELRVVVSAAVVVSCALAEMV